MAISGGSFVGSGEFVAVRVWSCPDHEYPETHECDCDHCTVPRYTCEGCAAAEWVDEIGDDGKVVKRELSVMELALVHMTPVDFGAESKVFADFIGAISSSEDTVHFWNEDDLEAH